MQGVLYDKLGLELDTQVKVLRFAYGLENWKEVIDLSQALHQDALCLYNWFEISGSLEEFCLERHILYYIGISKLFEGIAHQKMFNYNKAKECVDLYGQWDWVKDPDEIAQMEILQFMSLSKTNGIVIDILSGDSSKVMNYIEYIKDNDEEITAGLLTLLESNRMNGLRLTNEVEKMCDIHAGDSVREKQTKEQLPSYLKFLYEYTLYKIKSLSPEDAINTVLRCLTISASINLDNSALKYVRILERLRVFASPEHIKKYISILEEVTTHEKIIV
jgi:hypothetical protein